MLGLNDIQYLYELLFWFSTFFILKKVGHQTEVRLIYGYSVAVFNLLAVFFFSRSAIKRDFDGLDAFAFGFLHIMVAVVIISLVQRNKKLEN